MRIKLFDLPIIFCLILFSFIPLAIFATQQPETEGTSARYAIIHING